MRNILFFVTLSFLSEISGGPCNSKEKTTVEQFNSKTDTPSEEKIMSESEQITEFETIGILGRIQNALTIYEVYQKIKLKESITDKIKTDVIAFLYKIKEVRARLNHNEISFIVKNHIYQYKNNQKINILDNLRSLMIKYENQM